MRDRKTFSFSTLLKASLLCISLSGCVSTPDMTGWTPEQIIAYRQAEAQQMAQISRNLNEMNANNARMMSNMPSGYMNVPQVPTYTQPNSTVTAWCNQTSSYTAHCRVRE
jgi:hypothetical protein